MFSPPVILHETQHHFLLCIAVQLDVAAIKIYNHSLLNPFPFLAFSSLILPFPISSQTSELSRRIREAEKDVKSLVTDDLTTREDKRQTTNGDVENQQRQQDNYVQDGGSDDDLTDEEGGDETDHSYDALEDRFHGLEEAVAILVADVHDLALYTKLNITGFMKILKVNLVLGSPVSVLFT